MSTIIDTEPPPPPTLRETIEGLEIGQSLLSQAHALHTIRTTAARVCATHPNRKFRSKATDDGARIWRIA